MVTFLCSEQTFLKHWPAVRMRVAHLRRRSRKMLPKHTHRIAVLCYAITLVKCWQTLVRFPSTQNVVTLMLELGAKVFEFLGEQSGPHECGIHQVQVLSARRKLYSSARKKLASTCLSGNVYGGQVREHNPCQVNHRSA